MKKLLLILLCLPLISLAQSQEIHGVNLNGPKGFLKVGNLEWKEGNNFIGVQTFKERMSVEEHTYACQQEIRAINFLKMDKTEISGVEYSICIQTGDNGMLIGQVPVYKNGYTFYVFAGTFPADYKESERMKLAYDKLYFMIGYMITRISTY